MVCLGHQSTGSRARLFRRTVMRGLERTGTYLRICAFVTSVMNVEHMFLGTWADNNHDRSQKGRSGSRVYTDAERERYSTMNQGEKNNSAKLTEDKVREIKLLRGTMPRKAVAEKFGVTVACIKSIYGGYTWKRVKI